MLFRSDVARDIIPVTGGYAILAQSASFSVTGWSTDYDMVLLFVDEEGFNYCHDTPTPITSVSSTSFGVASFSPQSNTFCVSFANTPPVTAGAILNDWCTTLGLSLPLTDQLLGLSFYPDPTWDLVKVCMDADCPRVKLMFFDMQGRAVFTTTVMNGTVLNLSTLSPGPYVARIIDRRIVGAARLFID